MLGQGGATGTSFDWEGSITGLPPKTSGDFNTALGDSLRTFVYAHTEEMFAAAGGMKNAKCYACNNAASALLHHPAPTPQPDHGLIIIDYAQATCRNQACGVHMETEFRSLMADMGVKAGN